MVKSYNNNSIQATLNGFREKVETKASEAVGDRMRDVASYAVYVATPDESIDTGSYVTSFSIVPAGKGGGRGRSSKGKPRNRNPQEMKDEGFRQLESDIQNINFKSEMKSENARFTLRNRAPHSRDVENGENWRRDGYHVFEKIRRRFS